MLSRPQRSRKHSTPNRASIFLNAARTALGPIGAAESHATSVPSIAVLALIVMTLPNHSW